MEKKIIESASAPAAIGPYSQAVTVDARSLTFLSGCIPLDPSSGELVGDGDVTEETHRVMRNMKEVLHEANLDFENVVKTTIYLVDMNDFGPVNEVYAGYFQGEPPARVTVAVAGLPKGARVEIDCIAAR